MLDVLAYEAHPAGAPQVARGSGSDVEIALEHLSVAPVLA
jgi:hypothetical protein